MISHFNYIFYHYIVRLLKRQLVRCNYMLHKSYPYHQHHHHKHYSLSTPVKRNRQRLEFAEYFHFRGGLSFFGNLNMLNHSKLLHRCIAQNQTLAEKLILCSHCLRFGQRISKARLLVYHTQSSLRLNYLRDTKFCLRIDAECTYCHHQYPNRSSILNTYAQNIHHLTGEHQQSTGSIPTNLQHRCSNKHSMTVQTKLLDKFCYYYNF